MSDKKVERSDTQQGVDDQVLQVLEMLDSAIAAFDEGEIRKFRELYNATYDMSNFWTDNIVTAKAIRTAYRTISLASNEALSEALDVAFAQIESLLPAGNMHPLMRSAENSKMSVQASKARAEFLRLLNNNKIQA